MDTSWPYRHSLQSQMRPDNWQGPTPVTALETDVMLPVSCNTPSASCCSTAAGGDVCCTIKPWSAVCTLHSERQTQAPQAPHWAHTAPLLREQAGRPLCQLLHIHELLRGVLLHPLQGRCCVLPPYQQGGSHKRCCNCNEGSHRQAGSCQLRHCSLGFLLPGCSCS